MTINQALLKAVEAYKSGDVVAAKRLFSKIIRIEPNQPDANHNMGLILVKTGNVEDAIPFFKTALEANFSSTQYWFSYIDALFNLRRYTESSELLAVAKTKGCKGKAFDDLEKSLSSVQIKLEISTERLLKLIDQGELAKVLEISKKLLKENPNSLSLLNVVGLANEKSGNFGAAVKNYKQVLKIAPDNADAYFNMGNVLQSEGDLGNAIANYKKALKVKPNYANAYRSMGIALNGQGKLKEAVEAYTKALAIKPDFTAAYNNIGLALEEQGKLEEAVEAYTKALTIKPDYAEAYYNMGNAFKEQGKLEEAIEAYNKALVLKPYAEAYLNMGNALKEQGKLEEAIEAYNKSLSIKPDYGDAYFNMGNALREQGKLEEAIEAYNKALAIKPDNAEAYNNMGITLADQGKLEEAIEAYNKTLALKPDYVDAIENSQSLAVQLLPSISKYGYEFYNRDTKINPKIVPSPKYQIQNAIEAFLKADFRKTYLHNNNFKACDPNHLDKLLPNDKVFCNAYSIFLGKLLETNLDKAPVSEIANKVYHLGESHCLSYAHQNIKIDGSNFRIAPRITFGAKAFHFSRIKDDSFKAITKANFVSLPKCSKVFISFGEIDCRPNEGFIKAARKLDKPLEALISDAVKGYIQWFLEQNELQNHFLYFINVPAPLYEKAHSAHLNSEVARTVVLFNAALKKYSLQHGFDLVDVFQFTIGSDGFSNGLFHVDSCHLGAKAIPEIEQQLT